MLRTEGRRKGCDKERQKLIGNILGHNSHDKKILKKIPGSVLSKRSIDWKGCDVQFMPLLLMSSLPKITQKIDFYHKHISEGEKM